MELEQFKQILVDTQPYAVTDHSKISLEIYEGWADATAPKSLGDVIDAYATTKTKRFQLTTGALLSLASTLQIGADAVFATPPELLTPCSTGGLTQSQMRILLPSLSVRMTWQLL